MDIDLALLQKMHPRVPAHVTWIMVGRAALALERNGHQSGLEISWEVESVMVGATLSWPRADMSRIGQHDHNRITEDGAEAIALAMVRRNRAWRVIRRLQREEYADWLLEDGDELVALEISGVDKGTIKSRLSLKLAQVAKCVDVDQRWAMGVGFERPTAALRRTTERRTG